MGKWRRGAVQRTDDEHMRFYSLSLAVGMNEEVFPNRRLRGPNGAGFCTVRKNRLFLVSMDLNWKARCNLASHFCSRAQHEVALEFHRTCSF